MEGFYNKDGVFIEVGTFNKNRFTLKNLKKTQAKTMGMWNWHKLPDENKHYKPITINDKVELIQVPQGIRSFIKLEDRYGEVKKVNHPLLTNKYKGNELDILQDELINNLLKNDVGLAWSSTASGKSIQMAKIIQEKQVKTLVVLPNLTLLKQLQDDYIEIFGIKCRTLSGVKTKQKGCYEDILLANIDTVVKQTKEWLQQWGLILLDEVDTMLGSDNRREFIFNLGPKWLYGFTGTIKINYVENNIFPMYLGRRVELLLKNFIPTIYKVYTDFEYQLFDLKKFHELKSALYLNEERNNLIIDTINDTLGTRKGIVFCEYIEHSKILKELLEAKGIKVFILIGEITKEERENIKEDLKNYDGPCVLVGSVKIIGRGFSVPELSIGYLTTCEKFTSSIEQYCGRILRLHPGKTDAIWYDFVDANVGILYNQSMSRHYTYKRTYDGCKIIIR